MIRKVLLHILLKSKYRKNKTTIDSYNVAKDVNIGKYCMIGKKSYIDRNVKIGNFTYVNASQMETIIESNTTIGAFCSIAPGVVIGMGNHYVKDVATTHPVLCNQYYAKLLRWDTKKIKLDGLIDKDQHTVIGSDVWIGARANIKRGITIGNGAIVAGEAVVTKDVPDYAIVAGIPAKVIGYRFNEEQRVALISREAQCFWNWDIDYFEKNFDVLYDSDKYISMIWK